MTPMILKAFILRVKKIQALINDAAADDIAIFQKSMQFLIDLKACIQENVTTPVAQEFLFYFINKVENVIHELFRNQNLKSSRFNRIFEMIKAGLMEPEGTLALAETSTKARNSKKKKKIFAEAAQKIDDLLIVIKQSRINLTHDLVSNLLEETWINIAATSTSAEAVLLLYQIETTIHVIREANKYKLLTLGPIEESLEHLKALLKHPTIMKTVAPLIIKEKSASPARDRIWRIIHSVLKQGFDLIPFFDSDGNIVYQTRETMNAATANQVINALTQNNLTAIAISDGKKTGAFYVSVIMKVRWEPTDIQQPIEFKQEYKEDKEDPNIVFGRKIIQQLRSTNKCAFDILPDHPWPKENPEIIARRENIQECLQVSTQWCTSVLRIAQTMPKTMIYTEAMLSKIRVINKSAVDVVALELCQFGDSWDFAVAALYECAKKKIFPLDVIQIVNDGAGAQGVHTFLVVRRDKKQQCSCLKDMDRWKTSAFVIDVTLGICCAAQNYRLHPSMVNHALGKHYHKQGRMGVACSLENEDDLNFFIRQIEQLRKLTNEKHQLLPAQKPIVRFAEPPMNDRKALKEFEVLVELINVRKNLEDSEAETQVLMDSLLACSMFKKQTVIGIPFSIEFEVGKPKDHSFEFYPQ